MILIIFAAIAFYNYAKKNGLNLILWPIVAIVSYFGGQLVLGIILFMTILDPMDLNKGLEIGLNLLGGAIGLGIAYLIMVQSASKKLIRTEYNADILDDELLK